MEAFVTLQNRLAMPNQRHRLGFIEREDGSKFRKLNCSAALGIKFGNHHRNFGSNLLTNFLNMVAAVYLFFVFLTFPSHAAEVSVKPAYYGKHPIISFDGPIVDGDYERLLAVANTMLSQGNQIEVSINSSGGDFLEALDIARFIRSSYAKVIVRGNSVKPAQPEIRKCYSACSVILAAAANRDYVMDNEFYAESGQPIFVVVDGEPVHKMFPVVGLHRPSFEKQRYAELSPAEAKREYKNVERALKEFLRDSGAQDAFISRMFKAASNELDLLTKEEFTNWFPYQEPFLEEWLIAKCGSLDEKEKEDSVRITVKRAITGDHEILPNDLSEGYASYLANKRESIAACKGSVLLEHQRSSLETAVQKLGPEKQRQIDSE